MTNNTEKHVQEEMIEKTIATSSFLNGGLLNREQQDRFIVLVKEFSVMLDKVRFVRMDRPSMDIDKLHVGEPITESADENTATAATFQPQFNQVKLDAKKLKSQWHITTEVLQGNIEQDGFEQTIMDAITKRVATDFEDLAFNGDTALGTATPREKLLRRLDGWDKLSDDAHIVDAGGKTIQKGVWSAAKRAMPKMFAADNSLRWLVSDNIWQDWIDLISDRQTLLGDSALTQGNGVTPFGIPAIMVPVIPDDKTVTVSSASAAEVVGDRFGPFTIVAGSNDAFSLSATKNDGTTVVGPVAITLAPGTRLAVEIASQINSDMITAGLDYLVADDTKEGQLRLKAAASGVATTLTLAAGGNDALPTLGHVPGTTNGAASAGTLDEGSFIMLTNPANLLYGQLDSTRLFTEFNKDFDRIESVIYNQIDTNIENLDALVKVVNIRSRDLIL